jgi:DNA-binding LacI/PurR family transcriptional regulator
MRALHALQGRGDIERHGRRYRVSPGYALQGRNTIVLLARGHSRMRLLGASPQLRQSIRSVEELAARSGCRLVTLPVVPARNVLGIPNYGLDMLDRIREERTLLGTIVWATDLDLAALLRVVRHAVGMGAPVSLIEDSTREDLTRRLPADRRLRRFALSTGFACGRRIAQFLLDTGHRRVAYLSPQHRQVWSQQRLRGLRSVFAEAGYPDAVSLFSAVVPGRDEDLQTVLPEIRDTYQSMRRLELVGRRMQTEINRALKNARAEMNRVIQLDAYRGALRPLFRKGLGQRDITLWVCANDTVAVSALSFLKRERVAVPGDISVIGIDDSDDALGADITSFSFNTVGAVRVAVDHVLAAGVRRRVRPSLKPVPVEGYVVQRGTTRAL